MKAEVEVNVTFNYGAWELIFRKRFSWSFAPFYNMVLLDEEVEEEIENRIEFSNTDYNSTSIIFCIVSESFEVDVRNHWRHPVTDETVDETIMMFRKTGWERKDSTNEEELKALMKRDYERTKK